MASPVTEAAGFHIFAGCLIIPSTGVVLTVAAHTLDEAKVKDVDASSFMSHVFYFLMRG